MITFFQSVKDKFFFESFKQQKLFNIGFHMFLLAFQN